MPLQIPDPTLPLEHDKDTIVAQMKAIQANKVADRFFLTLGVALSNRMVSQEAAAGGMVEQKQLRIPGAIDGALKKIPVVGEWCAVGAKVLLAGYVAREEYLQEYNYSHTVGTYGTRFSMGLARIITCALLPQMSTQSGLEDLRKQNQTWSEYFKLKILHLKDWFISKQTKPDFLYAEHLAQLFAAYIFEKIEQGKLIPEDLLPTSLDRIYEIIRILYKNITEETVLINPLQQSKTATLTTASTAVTASATAVSSKPADKKTTAPSKKTLSPTEADATIDALNNSQQYKKFLKTLIKGGFNADALLVDGCEFERLFAQVGLGDQKLTAAISSAQFSEIDNGKRIRITYPNPPISEKIAKSLTTNYNTCYGALDCKYDSADEKNTRITVDATKLFSKELSEKLIEALKLQKAGRDPSTVLPVPLRSYEITQDGQFRVTPKNVITTAILEYTADQARAAGYADVTRTDCILGNTFEHIILWQNPELRQTLLEQVVTRSFGNSQDVPIGYTGIFIDANAGITTKNLDTLTKEFESKFKFKVASPENQGDIYIKELGDGTKIILLKNARLIESIPALIKNVNAVLDFENNKVSRALTPSPTATVKTPAAELPPTTKDALLKLTPKLSKKVTIRLDVRSLQLISDTAASLGSTSARFFSETTGMLGGVIQPHPKTVDQSTPLLQDQLAKVKTILAGLKYESSWYSSKDPMKLLCANLIRALAANEQISFIELFRAIQFIAIYAELTKSKQDGVGDFEEQLSNTLSAVASYLESISSKENATLIRTLSTSVTTLAKTLENEKNVTTTIAQAIKPFDNEPVKVPEPIFYPPPPTATLAASAHHEEKRRASGSSATTFGAAGLPSISRSVPTTTSSASSTGAAEPPPAAIISVNDIYIAGQKAAQKVYTNVELKLEQHFKEYPAAALENMIYTAGGGTPLQMCVLEDYKVDNNYFVLTPTYDTTTSAQTKEDELKKIVARYKTPPFNLQETDIFFETDPAQLIIHKAALKKLLDNGAIPQNTLYLLLPSIKPDGTFEQLAVPNPLKQQGPLLQPRKAGTTESKTIEPSKLAEAFVRYALSDEEKATLPPFDWAEISVSSDPSWMQIRLPSPPVEMKMVAQLLKDYQDVGKKDDFENWGAGRVGEHNYICIGINAKAWQNLKPTLEKYAKELQSKSAAEVPEDEDQSRKQRRPSGQ